MEATSTVSLEAMRVPLFSLLFDCSTMVTVACEMQVLGSDFMKRHTRQLSNTQLGYCNFVDWIPPQGTTPCENNQRVQARDLQLRVRTCSHRHSRRSPWTQENHRLANRRKRVCDLRPRCELASDHPHPSCCSRDVTASRSTGGTRHRKH